MDEQSRSGKFVNEGLYEEVALRTGSNLGVHTFIAAEIAIRSALLTLLTLLTLLIALV